MRMTPRNYRLVTGELAQMDRRGRTIFVSPEDEDLLSRQWSITKGGYAQRQIPPIGKRDEFDSIVALAASRGASFVYLHHVVLHRVGLKHRIGRGRVCDHGNRNKRDCRRENLNAVGHSWNATNRMCERLIGRGISFDGSRSLWHAKAKVGGKTVNLGRFRLRSEAMRRYDAFMRGLWGASAERVVNFRKDAR